MMQFTIKKDKHQPSPTKQPRLELKNKRDSDIYSINAVVTFI
jgi:hypothetical protein